jgi:Tol biopolymer transport system component
MGGGFDTSIAVSPNGRKLAFTIRNERTRLWSFPFDALRGQMLGSGEPVSARGTDALYPDVAANGTQVVYRTTRRGKHELWLRSLLDGQDRMLTSAEEILAPRLSDDGKLVAFGRIQPVDAEGSRKKHFIALMSADGRHERFLTTPGPKQIVPTDWSADGTWIVGACEYGPLGLRSVCLLPISRAPHAEEAMRIIASDPERNLYQATFSPNARWIGFNAASSNSDFSTLYVVAADGGQWTAITEGTFWDDKPRWSPDGRTIYFVSNRSGFLNVWARHFDPETGKPFGDPFRVTRFENPSERVSSPFNTMDLALTQNRMILPIVEASGAVWVLEDLDR